MNKDILYIGHRGTNIDADENTIRAFNQVIDAGAEYIEFDIRKTMDEKLIVMHNAKIDETTKGFGYVKSFVYDDLIKFKTKNYNDEIPTLEQVLDGFKNKSNIKFIIDLKERQISPLVLKLVQQKEVFDNTYICSANFKDLVLAKNKFPNCKTCYVIYRKKRLDEIVDKIIQNKMPFKIDMLSLSYNLVNKKITQICQENNITSLAWGYRHIMKNPLEQIKKNIEDGIDGIIFDNYKNIAKIKSWIKTNENKLYF